MDDPERFTVTRTSERVLTMERGFRASAPSVYAALTTPEHLRQWLTANGRVMTSCEVDPRPGGSYRYEFDMADGRRFGMFGTYSEVVPCRRIVNTEAYDGVDWEPLLVTTELAERSGVTMLTVTVTYPSEEICDRDAPNLESAGDAYTALDELLSRM